MISNPTNPSFPMPRHCRHAPDPCPKCVASASAAADKRTDHTNAATCKTAGATFRSATMQPQRRPCKRPLPLPRRLARRKVCEGPHCRSSHPTHHHLPLSTAAAPNSPPPSAFDSCGQLDLGPANRSNGFSSPDAATWGASALEDPVAGVVHLYAAEMAGHCNLSAWETASQIVRATAPLTSPGGPYTRVQVRAALSLIAPVNVRRPTKHSIPSDRATSICT